MVLEKTSENPLIARRSNQSILKEINPEYSREGLMLKLKLHCFYHLLQKANSVEKNELSWERLKAEGDGGSKNSITESLDMNLSKLQEIGEDRGAWHASDHGLTKRLDTT